MDIENVVAKILAAAKNPEDLHVLWEHFQKLDGADDLSKDNEQEFYLLVLDAFEKAQGAPVILKESVAKLCSFADKYPHLKEEFDQWDKEQSD